MVIQTNESRHPECYKGNGTWTKITPEMDVCDRTKETEGCFCGKTSCWDGSSCVELSSEEIYARVKECLNDPKKLGEGGEPCSDGIILDINNKTDELLERYNITIQSIGGAIDTIKITDNLPIQKVCNFINDNDTPQIRTNGCSYLN